jgi:GNAT superfamily N-acetyltransferase
MTYAIRPATSADIPHIVHHREQMFREMGTVCDFEAMADACARWYAEAVPAGTYRGWMAQTETGEVVGGGGLIVMPWSPGPSRTDPRMAWVFNVFVEHAHRGHGLAPRLMEAMHAWCSEQGIQRLALNATEAGARVYRGLGYDVVPDPMMRLDP